MAVLTLNLVVMDENQNKSTVSVYGEVDTTFFISNLDTFTSEIANAVDDLIGGAIVSIGWTYTPAFPAGLKATAAEDTDVEEGARFIFISDPPYVTSIRLPTFLETKITDNTKEVNLADAAVDTFVDMMIAGVDDGLKHMDITDYRGEDITVLKSARENFVKDRGIRR